MVAPIAEAALAIGVGLDQIEPRGAVRHAHDQLGANSFGRRQRQQRVGIGIIAERGRERGVDPGPGEIDRHVESVAGTADGEAAVAAAGEFDRRLAD